MADSESIPIPRPLEKALRFIEEAAAQSKRQGKSRLPPIKALAAKAGVSEVTLWKAMRRLHELGVVTVVPRGGVFVNLATPSLSMRAEPAPNRRRKPSWQQARDHVYTDIVSNTFEPGSPLPPFKVMCQKYGVCYATMRRSLQAMVDDSLLLVNKRRYVTRATPAFSSPASIVLIASTDSAESLARGTPRAQEFWRMVERECQRLNVQLDIVGRAAAMRGPLLGAGRERASSDEHRFRNVLGYLVLTQGMLDRDLDDLVTMLSHTKKPVSILEEVGKTAIPPLVRTHPLIRLFVMALGTSPGRSVGDFLIGLGHRRVACFSLVNYYDVWCINRMQGLRESFSLAGLPSAVTTHTLDKYETLAEVDAALVREEPFLSLRTHYDSFSAVVAPVGGDSAASFYNAQLFPFMWSQYISMLAQPLFEKALADTGTTAWVAVSDTVALAALRFLNARGVRVGPDISVVGYDDTIEAFASGLTSYNFNPAAVAHAMLDHIVNYRAPRWRQNKGPIEIPGFIMARGSTGPARKDAETR